MQTPFLRPDDAHDGRRAAREATTAWRQPVVWLGAVILLASIVGCLTMVLLAGRHDDPVIDTGGDILMKVPLSRLPVDSAAPRQAPATP